MKTTASIAVWLLFAIALGRAIAATPEQGEDNREVRDRRLESAISSSIEVGLQPRAMAISADGKYLAVTDGWDLSTWSVTTGQRVAASPTRGLPVAFSPTAPVLACGGSLLNSKTLKVQSVLDKGPVGALAFSPDGTRLVGTSGMGSTVWNVATRAKEELLSSGAESPLKTLHDVAACAFSPSGKILATDLKDGEQSMVQLWDAASLKPIAKLPHESRMGTAVSSIAFSADGKLLAEGTKLHLRFLQTANRIRKGDQMRFHVWDVQSRKIVFEEGQQCRGQEAVDVTFAPDRNLLATWGQEDSISLWDVDKHRRLQSLPISAGCVQFMPDGKTLVTASRTETRVRFWSVEKLLSLH